MEAQGVERETTIIPDTEIVVGGVQRLRASMVLETI
jgi:hypothetical protein